MTEKPPARAAYEEFMENALAWRGIDPGTECHECMGSGVTVYGSTATWRGGVGGAALTQDVCDKCWGSGCAAKPWPDRRRQEQR